MSTAAVVEKELKKLGSSEKKKTSEWFFKTGEGQYGFGDVFIGVTVPEQRKIARAHNDLPLSEIKKLLASPLHECRLTGLIILTMQYKTSDDKAQERITKFYVTNRKRVNNWDLVDASARIILGDHLLARDRSLLYTLAQSKIMWDRRIAIISTHAFIYNDDFDDTFALADLFQNDKEDLMHKAVGWMLREVGKRDRKALYGYLDAHAHEMPRTSLRYAIEHFSPTIRKKYMSMKKK